MPKKKSLPIVRCYVCDERKPGYITIDVCRTCYAGMYYWHGRSISDVIKHDKKLAVRRKRMAILVGERTPRTKKAVA